MTGFSDNFSERWVDWRRKVDLSDYDARWERLADQGQDIHGEADFLCRRLAPSIDRIVLDAGCGSGRVGVELAKRGFSIVGVDNDPDMLALARPKTEAHPALSNRVRWELANLSTFGSTDKFDMVALAGNVLVFAKPDDRQPALTNLVSQLKLGGMLVAGSSFAPGYDLKVHSLWCEAAGLELVECYSTWNDDPYDGGDYAVSVFRKP